MEHEDVEVVVHGQELAVYARNEKAQYKWTTNVGGLVKVSSYFLQRWRATNSTSTSIVDWKTGLCASSPR